VCGIAGYVGLDQPELAGRAIGAMTDALARRGPDGEGIAAWPGVALGHRRLAIIDLSDAGRQPMLSPDGQVGLVFNGCIYNFLELKAEMENLGYQFQSRCDTEVLLAGYQLWGIDQLVARLRGMFAFAIWDQLRRRLFLVRDRLGVKPLVFVASGRRIAFASTIQSLHAASLIQGEANPQAILEYLEFGFVTDRQAIYSQVSKVPPATIVEWNDGRISQREYWQLAREDTGSRMSFEEAVEETERRFVECVRLRLIADVPIAALLSGGIDSGLVCWALAKLNADVKAFTVSAPEDPSDETDAARATARALGIPHETITVSRSHGDPIDELVDAFGEPFACQSALGVLQLSRAIKPVATVLLTGDGGDDVFLGYPFFYNCWRAQKLARRMPPFAPAAWSLIRPLFQGRGPQRARNFLDYTMGGLGPYSRVRFGFQYYQERGLVGERLRGLVPPQRSIPPSLGSARHLLQEVFEYHRRTHFTGEFMTKVDGGSMYYAMEARAPFLDHTLWEFAASLPASIRFHDGALKSVLREIARRRIGPEVAMRPKQGFRVPAEKWLAREWRSTLETLQGDTLLEQEGWIRKGSLRPEIDHAITAAPDQLWYLVVLERWLRKQQAAAKNVPAGSLRAG
jgi:asparagine synthase (glutamine-hydrolysing)